MADGPSIAARHGPARPSLVDLLRASIADPAVVTWRCRGCGWEIWCPFIARFDAQRCETCACVQCVPPEAHAWNERVIFDREERLRREERRRADQAAAHRFAKEAVEREAQRRRRVLRESYAALAIDAGVVADRGHYDRLTDFEVDEIAAASELSELLHADLLRARQEGLAADDNVRSSHSLASCLGLVALFTDGLWSATGLSLLAWSARAVGDDWKTHRAAKYRDRWVGLFQSLTPDERLLLTRVFRHRFPAWAAAISEATHS